MSFRAGWLATPLGHPPLVRARQILAITVRCIVILVAGYIATSGLVVWGARGAIALGMPMGEALLLATMAGFLAYLGIVIWGFADGNLARVTVILVGGSAATFAFAS